MSERRTFQDLVNVKTCNEKNKIGLRNWSLSFIHRHLCERQRNRFIPKQMRGEMSLR